MIGLIKDEGNITIQFWSIFGSESGIPKYAQISIPYDPKFYGEYGIAWSFYWNSLPSVWISWGDTIYGSFMAAFKTLLKKW